MANINEEARIPVYINDEQAKSALKNLQGEAEKWRKKMFEAMESGNMKGMKDAERELKNVNKQVSQIKREAFDVNKVLQNIAESSKTDLKKALQAVEKEMDGLNRKSKEYKALFEKKMAIKDEFAIINGSLREQPGFLNRAAGAANKYFNLFAMGAAAVTGVVFSFSQFVKGMVGLDDALADVMKTTGLTRREVRELYVDFKYMNTRTPRKELLALAEEAGRLGKTGKKDIQDFIEVANKIKISLGDDLGGNAEEAIREVGKLTEIYRVGNQYGTGFKESMEKVGSGLNMVANNSNASAEYLIEYLKREGGVAVQAKIHAADIMGYASTFDQLGQNVEMAATAQSKVLVDMFTDPAKYAKIAKMEVGDFAKLLKTDANEAFIKFLEGLNGNNEGLSEMATKLDGLGIDGARATQALAALSSNTKMLREQQVLANDAMEKGTSLNQEYAIKNNNLAGSWERLTTWIHSKFINSGFLGFLEKVIGKTAELIDQPVEAKLRAEQSELNILVAAISNANTTQENRNDLISELQKNYPDFLGNLNAEKVTNEELQQRLEDVNKQYEDRILLMIKEDMLQKNYRERTELKMEELDLVKQIAEAEKIAGEARKKITPGMDANSYRNALSQQEFDAMNKIPILTGALERNREKVAELKKCEDDLNAALGELRKNRTDATGSSGTVEPTSGSDFVPGLNAKEVKKASDKAIEELEKSHNVIMSALISQYAEQGWTEDRFRMQQLIAEQAFLEEKKKLLIKYGQDTNDVDGQINQKKIDIQKEYKSYVDDFNKQYEKEQEETQKQENALIDAQIDATNQALAKSKDIQEKEKQQLEERARMYSQISGTIVDSLSSMLDGSLDEYASYGDALILMALDVLKQLAPIWAAQIVGGSLATPDSIMTGGISGIAKFTAMLAIMEGFIAVAEGAVKNGIENKRQAASGAKGFSEGGHTGPGGKYEPAGIVHRKEYVIPEDGTDNPGIKPFIDIMEIARRNGSLARLDLRPVMMSVQSGKAYSGGGPTSPTSPGSTPFIVQGSPQFSDASLARWENIVSRFEQMEFNFNFTEFEKMQNRRAIREKQSKLNG